jgi:hypothetical protein
MRLKDRENENMTVEEYTTGHEKIYSIANRLVQR